MRIDYATDCLIIEKPPEQVFNFISRGARYERWHFDYHLRAEMLDIRPEGVGSAFSIEELIDGFYLRHVGRVSVFERNRRFAWRGRFALFSWIWIGTDFSFTPVEGGTRVTEILYFEISPFLLWAALLFIHRRAFRPAACKAHIRDELSGVKKLLETGDHEPEDVAYPLADPGRLARVKKYQIQPE